MTPIIRFDDGFVLKVIGLEYPASISDVENKYARILAQELQVLDQIRECQSPVFEKDK